MVQEVSQVPNQDKYDLSQFEHNQPRSHSHYGHDLSSTENVLNLEYLSSPMNQQQRSAPETLVSNEQMKVRIMILFIIYPKHPSQALSLLKFMSGL